MRYGLYARKSDDDRKLTEKSIGEQVAECRRLAEGEGLVVARVWEESRSARVPDNRPLWKELVRDIRAGRIDGVLCWNVNRLARNMDEGGELVQLFVEGRLREIRTPHARFVSGDNILPLVIEAASATQYSIDLRRVVQRSMDAKAAEGGYNALAPQGYRNERDPTNGKRGTVASDPERFALMRRAWELMLTGGHTVRSVADTLNRAWGYRTRPTPRRGNAPLSENALYHAFRNPFYAGFVLSGRETVRGRHEAMVTPDEFRRVQAILSRRTFKDRAGVVHPFTGVMECGYCGQRVTAERKRLRNGSTWDTYHCSNSYRRCTTRGMSAARVEAAIAETLARVTLDPEVAGLALEEILAFLGGGERDVAGLLAAQEASRAECRARLDKLAEMWLSGLMTDRRRYAELDERETKTLGELALAIESARAELGRMRENARRARDFAAFSKESFLLAAPERRRAIAKALGVSYLFFGREKRLEIDADPLLLEFACFAHSVWPPLEPRRRRSKNRKQAPREETLVSGGPPANVLEPLHEGERCAGAAELPAPLVEALKGPLFADLGWDRLVLEEVA